MPSSGHSWAAGLMVDRRRRRSRRPRGGAGSRRRRSRGHARAGEESGPRAPPGARRPPFAPGSGRARAEEQREQPAPRALEDDRRTLRSQARPPHEQTAAETSQPTPKGTAPILRRTRTFVPGANTGSRLRAQPASRAPHAPADLHTQPAKSAAHFLPSGPAAHQSKDDTAAHKRRGRPPAHGAARGQSPAPDGRRRARPNRNTAAANASPPAKRSQHAGPPSPDIRPGPAVRPRAKENAPPPAAKTTQHRKATRRARESSRRHCGETSTTDPRRGRCLVLPGARVTPHGVPLPRPPRPASPPYRPPRDSRGERRLGVWAARATAPSAPQRQTDRQPRHRQPRPPARRARATNTTHFNTPPGRGRRPGGARAASTHAHRTAPARTPATKQRPFCVRGFRPRARPDQHREQPPGQNQECVLAAGGSVSGSGACSSREALRPRRPPRACRRWKGLLVEGSAPSATSAARLRGAPCALPAAGPCLPPLVSRC
jgi:hypothetical protein